MMSTSVSEVVRETRKARQANVRDFGLAIGLSAQTVSVWERGTQPSLENIAFMLASPCDWVRQFALDIYAVQQRTILAQAIERRESRETDCK